MSKLLH